MNICIIAHLFPARSETFVRHHAIELRRRGHYVSVIAREPDPSVKSDELRDLDTIGVERIYVGRYSSPKMNRLRGFGACIRQPRMWSILLGRNNDYRQDRLVALAKIRAIKERKPDIVHFHFGDNADDIASAEPRLISQTRCIVTWHGYDINSLPVVSFHQNYQRLVATPLHHTVGSKFIRQRVEALGVPAARISLIPMGADLERFTYKSRDYSMGKTLIILSVGRLEPVKGHSLLIDAVTKLQYQGHSVQLRIIGTGSMRPILQRQIDTAGMQKHIQLLGAMEPSCVAEEMHAAHLFALTGIPEANGKVESQGIVFAEAQATGLPVIGSRIGGVPESLIESRTGLLCAPGDYLSISDAILFFIRNPHQINIFGRSGRIFVESHLSNKIMTDRLESVYEELIKGAAS